MLVKMQYISLYQEVSLRGNGMDRLCTYFFHLNAKDMGMMAESLFWMLRTRAASVDGCLEEHWVPDHRTVTAHALDCANFYVREEQISILLMFLFYRFLLLIAKPNLN